MSEQSEEIQVDFKRGGEVLTYELSLGGAKLTVVIDWAEDDEASDHAGVLMAAFPHAATAVASRLGVDDAELDEEEE